MSIEVFGIVYKATNLINGKIYIGQTAQTLSKRRKAHENLAGKSTAYFHRALAKYGFENFHWEMVEACQSKDHRFEREIFWIEHFACMAPLGYNSAEGGKGGAYLETHKQRISLAMSGRKLSAETRQKLSAAHKGKKLSLDHIAALRSKIGEKNHFFGRAHSEETRKRIGEKSKGRNWATGMNAGSWADADRALILECYFRKMSNKDMIASHLERTGRKIGIKALMRVFRELGLHISETRGRRGLIERHAFIESNSIEVFYERLRSFTLVDDSESVPCSLLTSSSTSLHPL
ncbi:NUMOD3 domain-containing DNA-binding protein [Paraburkholderia panacisoli]|uniref:NUMOD3 domain-containing DNA-binding protein n=1 Tax=Paraburkholderia panacisoli TaxID=2603818 RepID=UPI00165F032E|nr:NUMOD3 domain-containing DNA-binding protein [Paraburkholderia panacisoli]